MKKLNLRWSCREKNKDDLITMPYPKYDEGIIKFSKARFLDFIIYTLFISNIYIVL